MQTPIGVIVAQLGTPAAPTARALYPYLMQFLSDRRVIDYSPFVWQPILRGIIGWTRPARSARLYRRIWMAEGSPLWVYTQRQAEGLQARLGASYRVVVGMTYGQPSIREAMRQLEAEGITRILVFPMYPQYSSTTTASVYDAAYSAAAGRRGPIGNEHKRFVPALRFVPPYYQHPSYIEALRARLEDTIAEHGEPQRFLFTFHGIPNRYVRTGDPYRAQCEQTARALADAMGLPDDAWQVSFQSQFGPEKWLEPYTEDVLKALPQEGVERLLVFAPGFTADCLETLDELGNEGREQFEEGGGHHHGFCLSPCLNDHPVWLDAMAEIARQETAGWVETPLPEAHWVGARG